MIAVPATPATIIASTQGANSRIEAKTKKPPEAVERSEEGEEVGRLHARGAVAEGDRRYEQREPAKAKRKKELRHELAAVGVGRADRRHDRLAGQDHHVADLLEQVLCRQEGAVGGATDHLESSSTSNSSWPLDQSDDDRRTVLARGKEYVIGRPDATGQDQRSCKALQRAGCMYRVRVLRSERPVFCMVCAGLEEEAETYMRAQLSLLLCRSRLA